MRKGKDDNKQAEGEEKKTKLRRKEEEEMAKEG